MTAEHLPTPDQRCTCKAEHWQWHAEDCPRAVLDKRYPSDAFRSSNLRVIEPFRSKDGVRATVVKYSLGGAGCVVIEADTATGDEAEVTLNAREAHDLMLWLQCALGLSGTPAVETPARHQCHCTEPCGPDGQCVYQQSARPDAEAIAAVPELKGKNAVVLYFETEEDREELVRAIHEAKPGMRAVKI